MRSTPISHEGVDLRGIVGDGKPPWLEDYTARALVVMHPGGMTFGEIAAVIADQAFRFLDAPVMRHGAMDTPVPFALTLEQQFLGVDRFKLKLKALLEY
jgi:pyruvate/2-oxoglutarate/acetoin dehydrogenase E1 component